MTINENYKKDLNNLVKVREGWKADYEKALAEIIRDRETQFEELVEEACERITFMTFDEFYHRVPGLTYVQQLENIQRILAEDMAERYRDEGEWE